MTLLIMIIDYVIGLWRKFSICQHIRIFSVIRTDISTENTLYSSI